MYNIVITKILFHNKHNIIMSYSNKPISDVDERVFHAYNTPDSSSVETTYDNYYDIIADTVTISYIKPKNIGKNSKTSKSKKQG